MYVKKILIEDEIPVFCDIFDVILSLVMPTSVSCLGGDRTVNGHYFKIHSYATPMKCDFCSKFMLGFIRQGMKCESEFLPLQRLKIDTCSPVVSFCCTDCSMNVHKMCLKGTIVACDQWRLRKNQCKLTIFYSLFM